MGFEPMMGVLQTPALPLGYVAAWSWCRGGDLNPYALTGTAPSRRRVYLFHHLGSPNILPSPVKARQHERPSAAPDARPRVELARWG